MISDAVLNTIVTTLGVIVIAYINRRSATKVKEHIDEKTGVQAAVLKKQDEILARVDQNVNGALTATKTIADQFAAEVKRVAREPHKPTPFGEPTPEQPVTLSAGEPATLRPKSTTIPAEPRAEP